VDVDEEGGRPRGLMIARRWASSYLAREDADVTRIDTVGSGALQNELEIHMLCKTHTSQYDSASQAVDV